MIYLGNKEVVGVYLGDKPIYKVYHGNKLVWELIQGLFVSGTVSDTAYIPRVYVNSQNTTSTSPTGGTWVDTVLEGNTWKVDLSDRLPLTGMAFMFYIASSSSDRNRYIDKIVFPSNIDTSNVTSMNRMFYTGSTSYTSLASIEGLEHFDTSNVTNMGYMFYNCNKLTELSSIQNWNVENVTNMQQMFYNCSSLTTVGDLSNWDTSNATNMQQMFYNCSKLTDLSFVENWDTSNATRMDYMFGYCSSLTSVGDLSNWDTSKVTNMSYMFGNCRALTEIKGLNSLVKASVKDIRALLYASNIKTIDVSGWDTSSVQYFGETGSVQSSLFGYVNGRLNSGVEEIIGLENFDFSSAISIGDMFHDCGKLKSVSGIENWHFANTLNVSLDYCTQNIFNGCYALKEINIRNWNTENWRVFYSFIIECPNLEILHLCPIGDGTHTVKFTNWLNNCGKLANIPEAGPIYNTVSFSQCPLTLDSAKVVLNALQAPYSGAQTLSFSTSTVNLVKTDPEAMALVYEKVALGWTINIPLPEYVFRIDAGTVQDNVVALSALSGQQVSEYEANKFYIINSVSGTTVDFSNRNVNGGLQFNSNTLENIYLQNNPLLTKFDYSALNDSVNTFKAYNTGLTNIVETANQSITTNKQIDFYTGQELIVGNYKYAPNEGADLDTAKLTVEFDGQGNYDVVAYTNYTKYEAEMTKMLEFDDSINQWIPSTYAAPADAPTPAEMYMSDSNWHKSNQFAKCYFNVLPQTVDTPIDLYINSYGEAGYDYTVSFSLDTDWTSTSVPSSTSTGVIAHTNGFSKDPSGSIATNYKKVSYTIPGDGQAHRILVIYRKDGSGDSYYDRGFVIAPYKVSWRPVEDKVEITGTVTDASKTPRVYVNSSDTAGVDPEGGISIYPTLDGNTWKADISDYLPLTGAAFMFYNKTSTDDNGYIDKIVFPEDIDTSNITSMYAMFCGGFGTTPYTSLSIVEGLDKFNTSNVTDISWLFRNCQALTSVGDLSGWDTSKVTTMSSMFENCQALTSVGDLSGWGTSKVISMYRLFYECNNLTNLRFVENWDVSKVINMNGMFQNCQQLTELDLSNWDTSKVTDMTYMFYKCSNLITLGLPQIGNGSNKVNTSLMVSSTSLANITASGPIYNSIAMGNNTNLTIESAKVVLNALQAPYSGAQSLKFSSATMTKILADPEAQALTQQKAALGWTIS